MNETRAKLLWGNGIRVNRISNFSLVIFLETENVLKVPRCEVYDMLIVKTGKY